MIVVGAHEAKSRLSSLLERVARGESITITRHGTPVAMLVPAEAKERPDVRATVEKLLEFGRGRTLGDLTLREMIEKGRP